MTCPNAYYVREEYSYRGSDRTKLHRRHFCSCDLHPYGQEEVWRGEAYGAGQEELLFLLTGKRLEKNGMIY